MIKMAMIVTIQLSTSSACFKPITQTTSKAAAMMIFSHSFVILDMLFPLLIAVNLIIPYKKARETWQIPKNLPGFCPSVPPRLSSKPQRVLSRSSPAAHSGTLENLMMYVIDVSHYTPTLGRCPSSLHHPHDEQPDHRRPHRSSDRDPPGDPAGDSQGIFMQFVIFFLPSAFLHLFINLPIPLIGTVSESCCILIRTTCYNICQLSLVMI